MDYKYTPENMDIYDHIHKFLKELDKVKNFHMTTNYRNLPKHSSKIKFIGDVLDSHNVLCDYKTFEEKNNKKSIEYRTNGNTYFSLKHKNYLKALEFYNKSICYAESNTECLAVGFANRSAVYYEWKLYRNCLDNIELAFNACTNLSEKLHDKLEARKKKCLDNIDNEKKELIESMELSYLAHPTIPFIVECLEMEESEQFGRFIKTTRDLSAGECIIIEKPTVAIVVPEEIYAHCAQCLIDNNYSLIPCLYCTATMYCSVNCRDMAYSSYHRFECSAIIGLTGLFNKIHLNALNIVLKLFSKREYLDKTIDYLNDYTEKHSYNFNYKAEYNYADEYQMLHSLVTNEKLRDTSDLFQRTAIAAILYKFLKPNKYLQEIFALDHKYEDLFLTLLFHNLQTAPSNFHSIMVEYDKSDLTYGSGAYPFSSLLNHSCAPNIMHYTDEKLNNIFITLKKIAKGEQLFDNYGYHHCMLPKNVRQTKLQQYLFKCNCHACELDWPLYHELKLHPKLPHIISEEVKTKLYTFDRVYTKKFMKIVLNYLNKYDDYYPFAQLYDAQEAFKMCVFTLYVKTSFGIMN